MKTASPATSFPVGIIAPSSKVPATEFALGVERIREAGLEPVVHPHVLGGHLFFAGTDEERARSVWEFANDPRLPVLWSARGGYGSMRILSWLDRLTRKHGRPRKKKLLAGFSDSTALMEFVRTRWGWPTLHAPMPGLRKFCALPEGEWRPLIEMIQGRPARASWEGMRLRFLSPAPKKPISGQLVGGNLTVWASLVGTPYAGQARGKIVFFEDVDENLYRVDRIVQQLIASGSLKGARAVVLGNFSNCRDLVPSVLAVEPRNTAERDRLVREPKPEELAPLRSSMEPSAALAEIFSEVTRACGVPVASGLPVGHGPEKAPLPMGGAQYRLSPRGEFSLEKWDWKGAPGGPQRGPRRAR